MVSTPQMALTREVGLLRRYSSLEIADAHRVSLISLMFRPALDAAHKLLSPSLDVISSFGCLRGYRHLSRHGPHQAGPPLPRCSAVVHHWKGGH